MKEPCLPRCYGPPEPPECDLILKRVCCIEWDTPIGESVVTARYDGVEMLMAGADDGLDYRDPINPLCYCNTNRSGSAGLLVFGGEGSYEGGSSGPVTGSPFPAIVWDLGIQCRNFLDDAPFSQPAYQLILEHNSPNQVPDYPGFPKVIDDELLDAAASDTETSGLKITPYLIWSCAGYGSATRIFFEAGWLIRILGYPAFMEPVARGDFPTDWWYGDPALPLTLSGIYEDWPDITVYPQSCNYGVCGDPLDCFAPCISGTEDCDGMTPAHVPVIYITFDTNSADCCISGTFAMRWTGSKYEIADPPTCLVEGCLITIEAELKCAYAQAGGPSYDYGPMTNTAVLIIRTVDGSGCEDVQAVFIVGLTCSGGLLNNASGTIYMDMVCNDSHETDLDWVLHG
jgi:hypothetical protein